MDISFSAAIDSVKVKVKEVDALVYRSVEMKFSCTFDDVIAAALSPDAKIALKGLRDHGMEQVVLPLDAVTVTAEMVSGDGVVVEVNQMAGIKATCKAGEDDAPPSIEFSFQCMWGAQLWDFLGRYCGAWVKITTSDRQLSMALPEPETKKTKRSEQRQ